MPKQRKLSDRVNITLTGTELVKIALGRRIDYKAPPKTIKESEERTQFALAEHMRSARELQKVLVREHFQA